MNLVLYHQQLQGLQVEGSSTSPSIAIQGKLKHNQELTKLTKWRKRLNWTKLGHSTQFLDTGLYSGPSEDNVELFPHRDNGDETLGTWAQTFISTPINLTSKPHILMYGSLDMLFFMTP